MLPEFNQDFRYAALQENAIQVIGEEDGKWDENDYALFYAQGPHGYNLYNENNGKGYKRKDTRLAHISNNSVNVYENFSYYFINFDKGEGKRVTSSDINPSPNLYTRYDDYQFINEEKNNFLNIGRLWVGDGFNANKSITFNTKTPLKSTDSVKVKSTIFVKNATNDKITLNINGQNSGTYIISNSADIKIREIPWESQINNLSGNAIKFDYILESTNPLVTYYLDYLEVQYKQDLVFNEEQMNFRVFDIPTGSGETFGFTVENAKNIEQIWDVSDITNAKKIVNKASGMQFSFGYTTNSPYFNNEFVAFKNSA
jgi:hypothetical protein